LVGKIVGRPREKLEGALAPLQLAEFIYEQPAAGDIEYRFKHQLTHEVAYNSVLVERRKMLHERVAQEIEELATNGRLDDYLADLAHHYGRSGNRTKAVDYLTRAGIQIGQRSAGAMQHFERALEILKEMPGGRSRDSRELQLQLAIGLSALFYQGEGSTDAGKALARAVELAVAPEDIPQKAYALLLLGYHHVARAELGRASEVSQVLYEISHARNQDLDYAANHLLGDVAFAMGEFRKAQQFAAVAASASRVPPVNRGLALVLRGQALWFLGFPDQAL